MARFGHFRLGADLLTLKTTQYIYPKILVKLISLLEGLRLTHVGTYGLLGLVAPYQSIMTLSLKHMTLVAMVMVIRLPILALPIALGMPG